eukprot:3733277-Amphidinium_carterae.3
MHVELQCRAQEPARFLLLVGVPSAAVVAPLLAVVHAVVGTLVLAHVKVVVFDLQFLQEGALARAHSLDLRHLAVGVCLLVLLLLLVRCDELCPARFAVMPAPLCSHRLLVCVCRRSSEDMLGRLDSDGRLPRCVGIADIGS